MGIFACDDEQVFKRAQPPYCLALLNDFFVVENDAVDRVVVVETAVYAEVGAGVGDVHRYIHTVGFPETLLRVHAALHGHLFEVAVGCRRYESHEVIDLQVFLAEGTYHVGFGF